MANTSKGFGNKLDRGGLLQTPDWTIHHTIIRLETVCWQTHPSMQRLYFFVSKHMTQIQNVKCLVSQDKKIARSKGKIYYKKLRQETKHKILNY